MTDLLAARSQMAMSLGFHIIFAMVGMAMPLLMLMAERRWHRTGDPVYYTLARRWAKGTALMFAVGAVSGTVLSFELGLLWPGFMEFAGPVIGMPFSLEGLAFFLEAIFLGVYIYGWDRVGRRAHFFSGVMVLICGVLSGAFVVCANAWMNTPTGFELVDGKVVDVDIVAAMFNPAAAAQVIHMTLAAFVSVGFLVAGVHAYMLLKNPNHRFHRQAFKIALIVGCGMIFPQLISGDYAAKTVAKTQPIKLAAMEGEFETQRGAPLRIGGFPDEETMTTPYAIEIPGLLSFLAYGDFNAEVKGLKDFPRDEWPPVAVVHWAFQIMVMLGTALVGLALLAMFLAWRKKTLPLQPWFLKLVVMAAPFGVIATLAGWTVTEVGRQPWIVHGILRTRDAVTPMPGLVVPFIAFTLLYAFLSVIVLILLKRLVFSTVDVPEPEVQDGA